MRDVDLAFYLFGLMALGLFWLFTAVMRRLSSRGPQGPDAPSSRASDAAPPQLADAPAAWFAEARRRSDEEAAELAAWNARRRASIPRD